MLSPTRCPAGESKITINNHCPPPPPLSSFLLHPDHSIAHSLTLSPVHSLNLPSTLNTQSISHLAIALTTTSTTNPPPNHKHAVSIPSGPPTLLRRFPPIYLPPGHWAPALPPSPEDPPTATLRAAKIPNSPSFLLQTPHRPKAPDLQAPPRPLPPRWQSLRRHRRRPRPRINYGRSPRRSRRNR